MSSHNGNDARFHDGAGAAHGPRGAGDARPVGPSAADPGHARPPAAREDSTVAPPVCPWQDALAAHALGVLADGESRDLLAHLDGGCPACVAEHARLAETLGLIEACEARDAAAPPGPGEGVRARLLRETAAPERAPARPFDRPWQRLTSVAGAETGDLTTIPGGPDGFERTGIAGIEVKPLFVDAARRRVSMLVRMAPGTAYPPHRHAGSEECFVVSGEIRVGERVLRQGDYQVAAEGSRHGVQSTERGCVLFIVGSQDDELV